MRAIRMVWGAYGRGAYGWGAAYMYRQQGYDSYSDPMCKGEFMNISTHLLQEKLYESS